MCLSKTLYINIMQQKYYDNDQISDIITLSKLIKSKHIDFPYWKYRLKKKDILEKFNNLKEFEPDIVHDKYFIRHIDIKPEYMLYNNKYTLILFDKSDYLNYNILSDYFNENCRMKCKRYDQKLSPYDFWIQETDKVIKYAQDTYSILNMYSLRESVWNQIGECTSFRPTILVSIINMFKSKKILDFSAGWGDRLIGAIASNVEYTGIDPNSCLFPNYKNIIKMFKPKKKIKMINKPFEQVQLTEKYDLVFTSPPYFILEEYTKETGQSILTYNTLDKWMNKWLLMVVQKAFNSLVQNGHLIIIINNVRGYHFVEEMVKKISNFKNIKYMGLISYAEKRKKLNPQPIWIWKKLV